MGIINVSELKPDMVLASDVKDRSGRLLMNKGTILTLKYIKVCKMWGVIEADVEGVTREDLDAHAIKKYDAAAMAKAEKAVLNRFAHNDMDHPAVRELFRLCTFRFAEGRYLDQEHLKEEVPPPLDVPDMLRRKRTGINPEKFIGEDTQLSTLPDIFRQINETISRPNSSAHDIAEVIGKDTNLSARLLKIVNSAFYGYPSKIDTLTRAVSIVGTKQLSTLAIGVNIIHMFKNIPSQIINMKQFWKHSILCGINARIIAGYKNIQNTERLFVAGLLHDIGRLLMYNYMPIPSLHAIMIAKKDGALLYRVEREMLGFDHAVIGAMLLDKWKLPVSLENTVKCHHDPQHSQNRMESAIVHLADIMANATGPGSSGEKLIPMLEQGSWTQIDLSPNILPLTLEQSDRQLADIFEFFFGDEKSTKTDG